MVAGSNFMKNHAIGEILRSRHVAGKYQDGTRGSEMLSEKKSGKYVRCSRRVLFRTFGKVWTNQTMFCGEGDTTEEFDATGHSNKCSTIYSSSPANNYVRMSPGDPQNHPEPWSTIQLAKNMKTINHNLVNLCGLFRASREPLRSSAGGTTSTRAKVQGPRLEQSNLWGDGLPMRLSL